MAIEERFRLITPEDALTPQEARARPDAASLETRMQGFGVPETVGGETLDVRRRIAYLIVLFRKPDDFVAPLAEDPSLFTADQTHFAAACREQEDRLLAGVSACERLLDDAVGARNPTADLPDDAVARRVLLGIARGATKITRQWEGKFAQEYIRSEFPGEAERQAHAEAAFSHFDHLDQVLQTVEAYAGRH